jgi:hypothetical protein
LQVYESPLNLVPGKISIQELQYRVLEATLKAQQEIITTQLQTRQESLVPRIPCAHRTDENGNGTHPRKEGC